MCAQYVETEINYRHVLPIIVVEKTILYILLYYCIIQRVWKRMHWFTNVTVISETITLSSA